MPAGRRANRPNPAYSPCPFSFSQQTMQGKPIDIHLIHGNEYFKKKQSQKWLIKNWIPERGIGMLYGDSATGKTFIALDLMLSISTGQTKWFGSRIDDERRSVVYLCGEGADGNAQRIGAWIKARNEEAEDTGSFYVIEDEFNLDNSLNAEALIRAIRSKVHTDPSFIVIDTLNCYFSGNENDATSARLFNFSCKKLSKAFNAFVLIIHHTGKNRDYKDEARGSSAFFGAMDTSIIASIVRDNIISLKVNKQKNGKIPEELLLSSDVITLDTWDVDSDGNHPSSLVFVRAEKSFYEGVGKDKELLIHILQKTGKEEITQKEAKETMKDLGFSADTIYNMFSRGRSNFLSRLVKAGIIEEDSGIFRVLDKEIARASERMPSPIISPTGRDMTTTADEEA